MIYTSYFGRSKYLPDNLCKISICAKPPEGFRGECYKLLAPSYSILMEYKTLHDEELYRRRYYSEILSKLQVYNVLSDLVKLSNGLDIVLLCYEKPEDFCHRHLVAEWLIENGIDCEEWKYSK